MTSRKAIHPVEALIPTTTRDPLVVVPIGEEDLVWNTQQQKWWAFFCFLEEGIQESLNGTHCRVLPMVAMDEVYVAKVGNIPTHAVDSLKLTARTWKIDGWKMIFLSGRVPVNVYRFFYPMVPPYWPTGQIFHHPSNSAMLGTSHDFPTGPQVWKKNLDCLFIMKLLWNFPISQSPQLYIYLRFFLFQVPSGLFQVPS